MGLLIHFLLLSGASFIIVGTAPPLKIIDVAIELFQLFSSGLPLVAVTKENNLKLLNGGQISATGKAIVWKGIYKNNTHVACKIVIRGDKLKREMEVFEALNATRDPNIEEHDIPRIHFHGKILDDKYDAIAMSLFDETVLDRYLVQKQKLSDLSILMIFKQTVEGLQYLHKKNVVHNDIKPNNIFLRGNKVFLGDFDMASLNGSPSTGFTQTFASSTYFCGKQRTARDDLESLVYTIWFISNVPIRHPYQMDPEGNLLCSLDRKAAESVMLEKCKHFENEHVYKAMKLICTEELISKAPVPNYKRIIDALTEAIVKVKGNSDPPKFEWLTDNDTAESSGI